MRLLEWDEASLQLRDPAIVNVEDSDIVTDRRETPRRNETDVPSAQNSDLHVPLLTSRRTPHHFLFPTCTPGNLPEGQRGSLRAIEGENEAASLAIDSCRRTSTGCA